MSTINFSMVLPPHDLARDIECIRISTYTGNESLDVKVCPKGLPGIVFQLADDDSAAIESITIGNAQISAIPIFFLHGQGSAPSVMRFKDKPYVSIQVVLKPHALYSLFGWDASSLNQGFLPPDQFGAIELDNQLLTASTNEERVSLLCTFLTEKMNQTKKRDELIEQSLDFIRKSVSSISVKQIVSAFHISERQFQKRFARVVGISPQLYIRIVRINEALRLMKTGSFDRLSDVAYALNYFDQSHFIRDIKAFSWLSPKTITMKVSDFHSDEAGSSYL
ncbi:helix-turn-helix transcriptional regulator [Paenibacillus mesophilus]|uniref:helix-turn-helix transcriptional regulator n=1 Tax=Paenibacillus mesophilus TaxID=2582849 RepID=UPI00110E4997|nr:helix-turn-helix transcriptional regulator [Paenibacillus mesophilus]TMV51940.1 helix-turn-helix transcriptional regulator [Paenibacillus mesophilus]